MTLSELVAFIRRFRYAVQASASADLSVQAATVGIAVSDSLEIVFDTLNSTRKARNLRGNPKIAFVIGGDEQTLQYQGVVDKPTGTDLESLKAIYYQAFPDGPTRLSWPGLIYLRARPTWIRFTDYTKTPTEVAVFEGNQLPPFSKP